MRTMLIIGALCALLLGCQATAPSEDWRDRPERQLATYEPDWNKPLVGRVATMPPPVLTYLRAMAPQADFGSYDPTMAERELFERYFDLLPSPYREAMNAHVARVYFVDNFDSGGMSDVVFDQKNAMSVVLYLNRRLFDTSLEEWIQYRDQAAFRPQEGITVVSTCSGEYRGLIHALVHEASHLYDYYHQVTPYVEEFQKDADSPVTTPFVDGVWSDLHKPVAGADVLGVSGYSGYGLRGAIDGSHQPALYEKLAASPFASLYGASSWAEDFAETFTWWYLGSTLDVEYRVTVSVDGTEVGHFAPFEAPAAQARVAVLETLL